MGNLKLSISKNSLKGLFDKYIHIQKLVEYWFPLTLISIYILKREIIRVPLSLILLVELQGKMITILEKWIHFQGYVNDLIENDS